MKVSEILRYCLALFLLFVGLNKFLAITPMADLSEPANNFMQALVATGYMMPLIGLLEIICGGMLLSQRSTPLALLILAPLSFSIILFHLFLDISSISMGLIFFAINVYLIIVNKEFYMPIIKAITDGKYRTEKKLQKMKTFKVSSTPSG